MNSRAARINRILLRIIAFLALAVLLALGLRYHAGRNRKTQAEAGSIQNNPVIKPAASGSNWSSLTFFNGSSTLSFELDEDGSWFWTAEPEFPLDGTCADRILDDLDHLSTLESVYFEEGVARPEDFGFDDPYMTLTAVSSRGTVTELIFGKQGAEENTRYVLRGKEADSASLVSAEICKHMDFSIYDKMILPEFPALNAETISELEITGAVDTKLTTENGVWKLAGRDVSSNETVRALTDDLSKLSFSRCVDYRASEKAFAVCGLAEPSCTLRIEFTAPDEEGTPTRQTLLIHAGIPSLDGTGRYIALDDSTTIYLLPTALLDPLMRISANGLES